MKFVRTELIFEFCPDKTRILFFWTIKPNKKLIQKKTNELKNDVEGVGEALDGDVMCNLGENAEIANRHEYFSKTKVCATPDSIFILESTLYIQTLSG